MKSYFYTNKAVDDKIYVFRNDFWINQLMRIRDTYCWVSLNKCNSNWDEYSEYETAQEAIEDVILWHPVYQLDTLEELADFIKES